MQFLSRVGDFMALNVIWLIFSIPIVTIGVSTTAYYYCMMKIVRGTDSGIFAMFFKSFKENLKQGIWILLIIMTVTGFLGMDLWICKQLGGQIFGIIEILLYAMLGLMLVLVLYVFPVLAQFENTIKNTIRNAFMMGISHVGKTFLIIIINLLPIAFVFFAPYYFILSLPIWALGGTSVFVFLNAKIFTKIFDKYIVNR